MEKLIGICLKSFRSLSTPGMAVIFVKSMIITVIFLVIMALGLSYAATIIAHHFSNWTYAGYIPWLAGIGGVMLAWMIFPGIMPLIVSFFDEAIIRNIEMHEYPQRSQMIKISYWQEFAFDLKFAVKALLLNLIMLPIYLIPVVNYFVFLTLNGYLLSNQFYITVACRHVSFKDAVKLRKQDSHTIFLGGILLVFLSTIPIINLIAPFWGVALMTHLYHSKGSVVPKVM